MKRPAKKKTTATKTTNVKIAKTWGTGYRPTTRTERDAAELDKRFEEIMGDDKQ